MTVEELRDELFRRGVPEDAYSLQGGARDECYVLDPTGSEWVVYYAERGLRTDERRFRTEAEACEEMLRRMRCWVETGAGRSRPRAADR
jgi:hypothetical protein